MSTVAYLHPLDMASGRPPSQKAGPSADLRIGTDTRTPGRGRRRDDDGPPRSGDIATPAVASSFGERHAALFETSRDRVHFLDGNGRVIWSNATARQKCHRPDESPLGRSLTQAWPAKAQADAAKAFREAQRDGSGRFLTSEFRAGREIWWDVLISRAPADRADRCRFIVIGRDISEHRAALAGFKWTAQHDRLTGLMRREVFHDRLDTLTLAIDAESAPFAVVLIDIDHFFRVNDGLGHQGGDTLLKVLGDRLASLMGPGDVAARIGGDEFGLILRGKATCGDFAAAAQSILTRLRKPVRIDGRRIDCSLSGGVAVYPHDGLSAADLGRHAGAALQAAKALGGGTLKSFDSDLRQEWQRKASMLACAEDALTKRLIVPHYQPKIDLRTGRIAGFEALLRWQKGSGEFGSPAEIAPAFEDANLSRRITEIMVERTLADLADFAKAGIMLPVAINVSDADLRQEGFADRLLARMAAAGISPDRIELEITENVLLDRESGQVLAALQTLSAASVRIALDDFGTGNASLTHLRQFPVDVIKIDRSFVSEMRNNPGDRAIVEAMLGLATSLSIDIVAEGIEDRADALFLAQRGCDLGQGYLFGKAIPADAVIGLLDDWNVDDVRGIMKE